jgi:uncharacterized protein YbcV (DUF1398 family)
MNPQQQAIARQCLHGAESNSMSFPQIVGALIEAGFEGYAADLRRAVIAYYLPNGDSIELAATKAAVPVAAAFDAAAVKAAIVEAQTQAPGYTYKGFCNKVAGAGCAGYVVSFSGRRVVYYGRTAELHVEHFPTSK